MAGSTFVLEPITFCFVNLGQLPATTVNINIPDVLVFRKMSTGMCVVDLHQNFHLGMSLEVNWGRGGGIKKLVDSLTHDFTSSTCCTFSVVACRGKIPKVLMGPNDDGSVLVFLFCLISLMKTGNLDWGTVLNISTIKGYN